MLERLIQRARLSRRIDEIVIATTEHKADDALEAFARSVDVGCFRGSENDVLGRIDDAIATSPCDAVVQLLGDNPLVDPLLVADVVDAFARGNARWVVTATNELPMAPSEIPRFPVGVRVEVFTPEAHRQCAEMAKGPNEREHSSSCAHGHPEAFDLDYFAAAGRWEAASRADYTFAINYRQNYEMVGEIFDRLQSVREDFSLAEIVRLVEAEPSLLAGMGPPGGLSSKGEASP